MDNNPPQLNRVPLVRQDNAPPQEDNNIDLNEINRTEAANDDHMLNIPRGGRKSRKHRTSKKSRKHRTSKKSRKHRTSKRTSKRKL